MYSVTVSFSTKDVADIFAKQMMINDNLMFELDHLCCQEGIDWNCKCLIKKNYRE